jgi:hypothetical protein
MQCSPSLIGTLTLVGSQKGTGKQWESCRPDVRCSFWNATNHGFCHQTMDSAMGELQARCTLLIFEQNFALF